MVILLCMTNIMFFKHNYKDIACRAFVQVRAESIESIRSMCKALSAEGERIKEKMRLSADISHLTSWNKTMPPGHISP